MLINPINQKSFYVSSPDVNKLIAQINAAGISGISASQSTLDPTRLSITSNNTTFYVGAGNSAGNGGAGPLSGSLALVKLSQTAPSAAQILKMYNEEKYLFQENAKATLYGTSDAVTALAYDGDTQLLHVGTSSGRSVFDGLRRVENTTTAVTTAISAADGLVVEN
jgi:hypothetical protein